MSAGQSVINPPAAILPQTRRRRQIRRSRGAGHGTSRSGAVEEDGVMNELGGAAILLADPARRQRARRVDPAVFVRASPQPRDNRLDPAGPDHAGDLRGAGAGSVDQFGQGVVRRHRRPICEACRIQLIQLDRSLRQYGSEADPARALLRSYTAAAIASTWTEEPKPPGNYYPRQVSTAALPRLDRKHQPRRHAGPGRDRHPRRSTHRTRCTGGSP